MRMPVLQQLFGNTDSTIRQTDIVMLLTPRIVRSHELTASDLAPIYIGPQSNLSLGGGPPPLISVPAEPPSRRPSSAAAAAAAGADAADSAGQLADSWLDDGAAARGARDAASAVTPPHGGAAGRRRSRRRSHAAPPAARSAAASRAAAGRPHAQPPPAAGGGGRSRSRRPPSMRVGAGPYTVPISISGASRLSTLSLSITYNPAVVRVRSVQEGTFMRQGGIAAAFTSQADPRRAASTS